MIDFLIIIVQLWKYHKLLTLQKDKTRCLVCYYTFLNKQIIKTVHSRLAFDHHHNVKILQVVASRNVLVLKSLNLFKDFLSRLFNFNTNNNNYGYFSLKYKKKQVLSELGKCRGAVKIFVV